MFKNIRSADKTAIKNAAVASAKAAELKKVVYAKFDAMLLSRAKTSSTDKAFYNLFKIENGKIVEHWDTIEEIPAKENCKNNNGKF